MLNKYEEIKEADMNRTCQSRLDSIVNLMDRRIVLTGTALGRCRCILTSIYILYKFKEI